MDRLTQRCLADRYPPISLEDLDQSRRKAGTWDDAESAIDLADKVAAWANDETRHEIRPPKERRPDERGRRGWGWSPSQRLTRSCLGSTSPQAFEADFGRFLSVSWAVDAEAGSRPPD